MLTTQRLWLAAALCVAPLGFVWSTDVNPGFTLYGDCGYSSGPYCAPDQFVPGSASTTLVGQAPIRVFLLFALGTLAYCAIRRRTRATRRLARLATMALGAAVALALAQGATRVLVCLLLALALVVPLVWAGFGARRVRQVK